MSRRYFHVYRFAARDETFREALSWKLYFDSIADAERIESFPHVSDVVAYRVASVDRNEEPRFETEWRPNPRRCGECKSTN